METLAQRREKTPAHFTELLELVRQAGTDNLSHFGNGYVFEGGYSLQQNPEEFAALVCLLREHPRGSYLEIGSASGGVARFLHENVGYGSMLSIDDGLHHRYPELAVNFSTFRIDHLRADSHSDEAKSWLAERVVRQIDVAFIDGDHTYEGAWMDVELVRPHLGKGSLVIMHDTVAVGDVKRAWLRGAQARYWRPLAEYIGEGFRPLGIGVGVVP